jgi:DEAD/DEAH box helicase domain-containing protein
VARATLGTEKSGDGLQAVRFYERGEMDRLRRYCLDDVRITREVYEHGCREGKVWIPPKFGGDARAVPVPWGQPPPETPALRQGSLF